MSVNLSGRTFEEPDLSDYLAELVDMHGLVPGQLAVEVTERVLLDKVESAARVLARFKEIGVPLLIDDFGTGYSSLAYLHRFPFDVLKIDKSFVLPLATEEAKIGLVEGVVSLSHVLEMKTVAEGVESERHAEILRAMGCDYGQGYLFARPAPIGEALRLLREGLTTWVPPRTPQQPLRFVAPSPRS